MKAVNDDLPSKKHMSDLEEVYYTSEDFCDFFLVRQYFADDFIQYLSVLDYFVILQSGLNIQPMGMQNAILV